MQKNYDNLQKIIDGGFIRPVYQPIVSLKDGHILGYEALSRISCEELKMNIESMFYTADKMGNLWELETLCRTKALEHSKTKPNKVKLFLNVNSNIMYDKNFQSNFTKQLLHDYKISADDIVFEITERVAVLDRNVFFASIDHYKNQHYGIAIDDVGAGFSGLNMIVDILPNFLKLDMNLVRNIDKDEIKISLCKAFVEFCNNSNINLVAEGIESEEELKTLIDLGVQYGQGYFLAMPKESFEEINQDKKEFISNHYSKHYKEGKSSVYPIVEHLCKKSAVVSPATKAVDVYELTVGNPTVTEICVVENDKIVGFMTKSTLNKSFSGQYGYSLHGKKNIAELMETDFLRTAHTMPVDAISRIAMQRPYEQLYDPIVVEKDGGFCGIVTVKDLLDACTKIQVSLAMHANPLTGLPGNLMLENEIINRILGTAPFCITYYDLDNFKGYNDAYGFSNGDQMLVMIARILKQHACRNEFVGHIGGDDFIVIADYLDGEEYCEAVLDSFSKEVLSLYRDEDIQRGYIISKNRHGVTENFPIASISIAGLTNKKKSYRDIGEFSKDAATLKKICKQHTGNYYEIW